MTRWRRAYVILAILGALLLAAGAVGPSSAQGPRPVVVLDVDGPIGPATSDYIGRGLADAVAQNAQAVILRMDTPGGLDTSMRVIIRDILASPVPVITYVAPSGARAASAGTYILYASHVAAMAPGTNLGAATPIQIGAPGLPGPPEQPESGSKPASKSDGKPGSGKSSEAPPPASHPGLPEKAVNDASAYIRSLAELRGRNVEWAEKAVREAASLPAEDALKAGVIDLIAADVPSLMAKLDGRQVTVATGTVTLATRGAVVTEIEPGWRTKLLALITNPNVASILMLIGIYGLIFEFYSPGLIGPGVIGAICLLLALYAFHVLPVDYTGVFLLILGIGMMVAEVFIGAFGALGVGGLAAFVIGSIMLMEESAPGFTVAWELVGSVAMTFGLTFLAVAGYAIRARRRPIVTGREEMVGSTGPVVDWAGQRGRIRVRGELWNARGAAPLTPGQQVRVSAIDGLTLQVEPAERGSD